MPIAPAIPWLTREDVDAIADAISVDDLIEATAADKSGGTLLIRTAFNLAAERSGLGEEATKRVRGSDFKYLAEKIAGVVNVDNPLSQGTEDLLPSAASGE